MLFRKEIQPVKTLFINACVRDNSRTLILARHLLEKLGGDIEEVFLPEENILPLDGKSLARRDELLRNGELDAPEFRYARQFAAADVIVIAAPLWDLSFPACLKCYIEAIMVSGMTFQYSGDRPHSLCRAKKLIYVTTSGGEFIQDYGYNYVEGLAHYFFGIKDTMCLLAENLDIEGADVDEILKSHIEYIDSLDFSEEGE